MLGLIAAHLLERPGGLIPKVDPILSILWLVEVVAIVDIGVGSHGTFHIVSIMSRIMDLLISLPIRECIGRCFRLGDLNAGSVASDDVQHDVFLLVASVEAPFDSVRGISIVDGTTIHVQLTPEWSWLEPSWNRGRGKSNIGYLIDSYIILGPSCEFTSLHIAS